MDTYSALMGELLQNSDIKKEKYLEVNEITKGVEKRFRTSYIGNLNVLESQMGFLWGHGKPVGELTRGEAAWREVWVRVREEILNHSNNQMRQALKELLKHLN